MRIDFIEKGARFSSVFHQVISKIEKKLFHEASNVDVFIKDKMKF